MIWFNCPGRVIGAAKFEHEQVLSVMVPGGALAGPLAVGTVLETALGVTCALQSLVIEVERHCPGRQKVKRHMLHGFACFWTFVMATTQLMGYGQPQSG